MTTYKLYWTSKDGQASMEGGEYESYEAAEFAIDEVTAEFLDQCADEEQRAGIEAGSWDIEADTEE